MPVPSFSKWGHFKVTRVVDIPEIGVTLTELVHEKTGSKVMHLASDDDENLFNLSFQTIPNSSNGVAHILEHTVLCGSKHFPVKDPFFSMGRRSMNTFMNAFTGADFTCYPASSQIPQDFYNLLEVYLDAVFYPKLTPLSFLQEGHRLEFSKKDDPTSPLTIKGIVYNEMKGALASAETRLNEALMEALFPDVTYGVNSGGTPKEIANLTHEELLAFHKTYYHPSRCLFFFYGNLPLETHLDFIEEKVLKNADCATALEPLALQPRFTKKVKKTLTYPYSKEEDAQDGTLIGFGWLTTSILQQEDILALSVLDLVLMGTDASPLKMALLKSGLCKQADSSLEDECSEVPFILVCKGCPKDSEEKLEKLIVETLEKVAKEGIAHDLIEGAIHQLEFSRNEISSPFGLSLYFRSALLKHHGGKPEDGLKTHTLFSKLREKLQDPRTLSSLIQTYLLQNTHRARVVMHPDKQLEAKESAEEEKMLQEIRQKLTPQEIQKILETAVILQAYQEKEENLDVLPKITLSDVPPQGKEFPLVQTDVSRLSLHCHPTFTNEIVYVDLVFDLPHLREDELSLLRLFSNFLTQMGAGGRNYQENLDYIFKHTGGIGADPELFFQASDPTQIKPALVLKAKALYRKADKLFALLCDFLTTADFTDTDRLQELLMQHFEELETSIQNSPLRYAMQLGASGFSIPLSIRNKWYGLAYYEKIKTLVEEFEKDPLSLVAQLQSMQKKCLALTGGAVVLSCDRAFYEKMKKERFYGLENVAYKTFEPWKGVYSLEKVKSQARVTAAPIVFTTLQFPTHGYLHPEAALLSIASKLMENKTLHKRIREQGGAYGSGASHVPMSGHFYFYSYRDPHLKSTLEAFSEAAHEISLGSFDTRELEEAKLGILQDLDSPVSPGSKAFIAYDRLRSCRTPEYRQLYRERLLKATKDEVVNIAKEVLLTGLKEAVAVSFGSKELLEREKVLPVLEL